MALPSPSHLPKAKCPAFLALLSHLAGPGLVVQRCRPAPTAQLLSDQIKEAASRQQAGVQLPAAC